MSRNINRRDFLKAASAGAAGLVLAEFGWDDFKGVDVKGSVMVLLGIALIFELPTLIFPGYLDPFMVTDASRRLTLKPPG